jgi:hypothetical protein
MDIFLLYNENNMSDLLVWLSLYRSGCLYELSLVDAVYSVYNKYIAGYREQIKFIFLKFLIWFYMTTAGHSDSDIWDTDNKDMSLFACLSKKRINVCTLPYI